MAKTVNSTKVAQNGAADFARFQDAVKTILKVSKDDVVKLEKNAKVTKVIKAKRDTKKHGQN